MDNSWDDEDSNAVSNRGTRTEEDSGGGSSNQGFNKGGDGRGFHGGGGRRGFNEGGDKRGFHGGGGRRGFNESREGRQFNRGAGREFRGGGSRGFGGGNEGKGFNRREEGGGFGFGRSDSNMSIDDKRDFNRNYDNSGEMCEIYVESSKLGKLIGKGGSQIRDLTERSGAKININKNCVNGDTTQVTISGSKSNQDSAKSMIEDLLRDDRPKQYHETSSYQNNMYSNDTPDQNVQPIDDASAEEIDWGKAASEHAEYQKQKWAKAVQIKKNFYVEDPFVASMSKEEVEKIRLDKNNIQVDHAFDIADEDKDKPEFKIPNPILAFEQAFHNFPDILKEIVKAGFEKPSPIQCQAWPVLLSGKDMIGIAQTGTGKTLAFLLPALIHIDNQITPREKRSGPTVLVMAPTRELAQQIEKEVNKYEYHNIKACCVYGGGSRKDQMYIVSQGVEIVIATPGRLNDLVQSGHLDVKSVSYLVLDEADRMLDMGFEPQIRKTLLDVRPDRQTVMTSATWPEGVRRLARSYMVNPVTVCVGTLDLRAANSVTQKIYIITEEEKDDWIRQFFQSMGPDDKAIVFFGRKTKVDHTGSDLAISGVRTQSIHGDREQEDREQALEDIKKGHVQILLATDVASRGLDIEDITHVINYDFPREIEEYVHRVGRTGRAGRTGESISLFTRSNWGQAANLIKILEDSEQEIPQELYSMAERYEAMQKKKAEEKEMYGNSGGGRSYGGGGRDRYGGGGGGGGGRDRYGGGGRRGSRY